VSSLAHFPGHVTQFLLIHRMLEWANKLSRNSADSAQHILSCGVQDPYFGVQSGRIWRIFMDLD